MLTLLCLMASPTPTQLTADNYTGDGANPQDLASPDQDPVMTGNYGVDIPAEDLATPAVGIPGGTNPPTQEDLTCHNVVPDPLMTGNYEAVTPASDLTAPSDDEPDPTPDDLACHNVDSPAPPRDPPDLPPPQSPTDIKRAHSHKKRKNLQTRQPPSQQACEAFQLVTCKHQQPLGGDR